MKAFMLVVLMVFSGALFATESHQQQTPIQLAATNLYFGVGPNYRYHDRYYRDHHRHHHRCYVKRCWKKHGYVKCRYYQTRCRYR